MMFGEADASPPITPPDEPAAERKRRQRREEQQPGYCEGCGTEIPQSEEYCHRCIRAGRSVCRRSGCEGAPRTDPLLDAFERRFCSLQCQAHFEHVFPHARDIVRVELQRRQDERRRERRDGSLMDTLDAWDEEREQ